MRSAKTAYSRVASTVSSVPVEFSASSEIRIIWREAVESGFIALMKCDGSSESESHADPDEGGRTVDGRQ